MVQQNAFQIQFQPSDAILSVRTALAYKYKPTVRYSVELFRNDPKILGELRVSARTQNAGLLRMLDHFFRLWEKLENRYLSAVYPAGVSCRIENISSYIQNFDCALKAFFELDEQNWKVGIDQISLRYQKALQKEKILL